MGWVLSVKPRTLRVTPALARLFAEMDAVPRDRPLSERRLQVYQRLFARGQFRPVTWAKAVCKETGGTYRVNGKHTSILLSGMKTLPEFFVTIEEYSCDTLDDVSRLYATFDSKTQSRTSRDINLSFAGTISELDEVSSNCIGQAVAGMSHHIWQGRLSTTTAAERAELLLEHTAFVLWLSDLMNQDGARAGYISAKRLGRQPVVGAMFATWQKDGPAATRFWREVRDETGKEPTAPDRVLSRYIRDVNSKRGGGARWGTRHADNREQYVKCLHAWNAWRTGEKRMRLQYFPEAAVPDLR